MFAPPGAARAAATRWAPSPQRYFTYDKYWKPGGPIFFYCGNEANVELYVNATGLMWENAEEMGAMMLFVEHRYYGDSLPFGAKSSAVENLQYLTMEQALADYAHAIYALKNQWDTTASAVVAFGGSYGGMLASWLRMKYPGTVDGAIAGSAPILGFQGDMSAGRGPGHDFADGASYWSVVGCLRRLLMYF
jgi:lysosomal Pro-X carboxypeptidase